MAETLPDPDENNVWRLETPGESGWSRSARPDAADKFFMCSADGHVQEPNSFLSDRIDEKYHHRLLAWSPAMAAEGEAKGEKELFQKTEGFRLTKINWAKPLDGHDKIRNEGGRDPRRASANSRWTVATPRSCSPTKASRCGRRRTPSSAT